MKKYCFLILSALVISYPLVTSADSPVSVGAQGTNPFSVATPSVVQGMVAGSSQQLVYTLSSPVPKSASPWIQCTFTPGAGSFALQANFNNSGCTLGGGVGVYSGLSIPVTLTLTVPAGTPPGTLLNGTLQFKQSNGMKYKPAPINISIPVASTSNRTVTFKNYCSQPVVIGATSSSVPALNINTSNTTCNTNADCSAFTFSQCISGTCGGGACISNSDCQTQNPSGDTCLVPQNAAPGTSATCTYCAQDSDCIAGSSCNTSTNLCFWNLPTPTQNGSTHYSLSAPSGGVIDSATITLPDNSNTNGFTLLWGGGFAGRTGCTLSGGIYTCKTADCNNSGTTPSYDTVGSCSLGVGFNTPSTSAEVTFVATTPDTYDITIINGPNVPMSMYPTPGSAASPQTYNNPYTCGKPGSGLATVTQVGTLGGCSWDFSPPSVAFRWVDTDNGTSCSNDLTCKNIASTLRCGLTETLVTTGAGSTATVCGTPLGYWNQNEICAANSSFNQAGIVNCTISNVQGTGNSIINLLACTAGAAVSCFNVDGANNTCCGCTNWQNYNISVPSNPSIVTSCSYPNPYWAGSAAKKITGLVLPNLIWLKSACPSAYVYSFDDKSATFTCPANVGQSAVNYTVDFCPPEPA